VGIPAGTRGAVGDYIVGTNVPQGFADLRVSEELWLPAGQTIRQSLSMNLVGSTLRGAEMVVERIP
jgi:hypothetical protein